MYSYHVKTYAQVPLRYRYARETCDFPIFGQYSQYWANIKYWRIFKLNIRPILNIRPKYWPNITFGATAGPGDAIKYFHLACPTQNTIPSQYRPGTIVYWALGAKGSTVEFNCRHCHGVARTHTASGASTIKWHQRILVTTSIY